MKSAGGKPRHHGLKGENKMKIRQRMASHRQRKFAAIRKEAARYKDGQGKERAAAAQKIAHGFV